MNLYSNSDVSEGLPDFAACCVMPQTPLATPAVMDPRSVGTGTHEAEIGSSALISKVSNESAGRVAVASRRAELGSRVRDPESNNNKFKDGAEPKVPR